jgi:hypothetical protein
MGNEELPKWLSTKTQMIMSTPGGEEPPTRSKTDNGDVVGFQQNAETKMAR